MYITKTAFKKNKKKTEPKETVSGKALVRKPCCRAERTESSKRGISKTYEEKEKEGVKEKERKERGRGKRRS